MHTCQYTPASGAQEESGITLMQNKPEIDAMLQEYEAAWSEANGIAKAELAPAAARRWSRCPLPLLN